MSKLKTDIGMRFLPLAVMLTATAFVVACGKGGGSSTKMNPSARGTGVDKAKLQFKGYRQADQGLASRIVGVSAEARPLMNVQVPGQALGQPQAQLPAGSTVAQPSAPIAAGANAFEVLVRVMVRNPATGAQDNFAFSAHSANVPLGKMVRLDNDPNCGTQEVNQVMELQAVCETANCGRLTIRVVEKSAANLPSILDVEASAPTDAQKLSAYKQTLVKLERRSVRQAVNMRANRARIMRASAQARQAQLNSEATPEDLAARNLGQAAGNPDQFVVTSIDGYLQESTAIADLTFEKAVQFSKTQTSSPGANCQTLGTMIDPVTVAVPGQPGEATQQVQEPGEAGQGGEGPGVTPGEVPSEGPQGSGEQPPAEVQPGEQPEGVSVIQSAK